MAGGKRNLVVAGTRLVLFAVLALGFLDRLLLRFSYGDEFFWKNGYSLFYDLAESIAAGRGLSYQWLGLKYAHRPPVYPLFLFITMLAGKSYVTIVALQSAVGAGTCLCAFLIGKELFDERTGLLAAFGVAVYPYFVMHDTALQETGLFTFLTALSVFLLLKSRTSGAWLLWIMAGICLGIAVLTRATLAVFVPLALIWLLLFIGKSRRQRLQTVTVVTAGLLLVISPWVVRNYFVLGTPTFSTLTGLTLWASNNPYTFANYPAQSIDYSTREALKHLKPEESERLLQLSNDEVGQDSWFIAKAEGYMRSHRRETLNRAFRKIGAAYSIRQNPAREGFVQTAYFLSYLPALLLGCVGAFLARRQWREHSLIYGLFLAFTAVTSVFFSHTSHRSYLDVYLIVFSAFAVMTLYRYSVRCKQTWLVDHASVRLVRDSLS